MNIYLSLSVYTEKPQWGVANYVYTHIHSEKCVTPVHYISELWIIIGWKPLVNFPSQWYYVKWWRKVCAETLKKFFLMRKMASRKISRYFLYANIFMIVLLIGNHTVFLVQFGIHLHFQFFKKLKLHSPKRLVPRAISAFRKTHSCKLIQNWMRKTSWVPTLIIWRA